MVILRRVRFFRIFNAGVFFLLAFAQMIIVSWISISQNPREGAQIYPIGNVRLLGFYISINPFTNQAFTVLLVFLTAGLQILLLAFLVKFVFSNKSMIQIFPEPLYGPAYGPEEAPLVEKTVQLVSQMSKKAKIKVKKIFVYRKAVPNAFSLDLVPIPFFRRPYLVLNTNVLEILSDNELKAVIAHELAHVSHGDSLVRLILSIPRLYLNLVYLFIYLQILTGIQDAIFESLDIVVAIERLAFLGLVYLILIVLTKVTLRFLYSANRQAEYLADYFAAQLVGSDVLINSLIHLGQRSETMQVLLKEIEWLQGLSNDKKISPTFLRNIYQRFPKTQLDEDHAREIAPRLFLEEKFSELINSYNIQLDIKMINELIVSAVSSLLERRAKYFDDLDEKDKELKPSYLKEKTIDWRRFDSDESQYLEPEEINSFIATLITHSDKMVFEHELFQLPEKNPDHPSYRDRILNIYRVFHMEQYEKILQQASTKSETQIKNITESQI
jgi:heat shock protein HtpX